MALFDVKGLGIPYMWTGQVTNVVTIPLRSLDSNDDKLAIVCQLPHHVNTSRLGLRYGTRTGTPPVYKISLQGVDGSGNPDGIIKGGASFALFHPPADTSWNNTWRWFAIPWYLGDQGEFVSVVIEYESGTVNGSNNSSFAEGLTGISNYCIPYNLRQLNGGAWTKLGTIPASAIDCFTPDLNQTPYVVGFPVESIFQTDIATIGHRQAFEWDLTGVLNNARVRGIRFLGHFATGGSVKIIEPLGSTFTVPTNYFGTTASFAYTEIILQDQFTLSTGGFNPYRIGIERVDVAVGMRGIKVAQAYDMMAFYGGGPIGGSSAHANLATFDGVSWTSDIRTRLFAELILDGGN